ncbi:MAG: SDR family NAD(P)-dependent oxidoreductase [Sarcina sp.]
MKRALITGGTRGMGKAMSIELAKKGYEIHIIGRNKERGQDVINELIKINPNGKHKLFIVDLALIEENKRFLNKYKEEYKSLDLLLLNANIRPQKKAELTDEGYNNIFATGYVSKYLFTIMLEEILLNSTQSKIVHIGDARLLQKLGNDNFKTTEISGMKSLLASYTGSAYMTYFLNEKNITKTPAMFVNPGMVDTNSSSGEKISFWIRIISKKPEIIAERIIDNVDSINAKECAKKFYNIDKVCGLNSKIAKKKTEFNDLYKMSSRFIEG